MGVVEATNLDDFAEELVGELLFAGFNRTEIRVRVRDCKGAVWVQPADGRPGTRLGSTVESIADTHGYTAESIDGRVYSVRP
jgi:hypothetical protein